jgi:transcription antitermination factor NusG
MSEGEWFVIRVKSNFERHVSISLRSRGIEEYVPLYRLYRTSPVRARQVDLPLFPGYVFSRFEVNNRLSVLTVPGVVHILSLHGMPIPVESTEMARIKAMVASGLRVTPWPFVAVGQRVLIESGPLRGVEGLVIAIRNGFRLIASVTLLQRSVSVDIDCAWVRGISEMSAPAPRPDEKRFAALHHRIASDAVA